jgi:hypothetical protein
MTFFTRKLSQFKFYYKTLRCAYVPKSWTYSFLTQFNAEDESTKYLKMPTTQSNAIECKNPQTETTSTTDVNRNNNISVEHNLYTQSDTSD